MIASEGIRFTIGRSCSTKGTRRGEKNLWVCLMTLFHDPFRPRVVKPTTRPRPGPRFLWCRPTSRNVPPSGRINFRRWSEASPLASSSCPAQIHTLSMHNPPITNQNESKIQGKKTVIINNRLTKHDFTFHCAFDGKGVMVASFCWLQARAPPLGPRCTFHSAVAGTRSQALSFPSRAFTPPPIQSSCRSYVVFLGVLCCVFCVFRTRLGGVFDLQQPVDDAMRDIGGTLT